MDKFIDDFDKIECIKAEFEQKSYIKLYKIWKSGFIPIRSQGCTTIGYSFSGKDMSLI